VTLEEDILKLLNASPGAWRQVGEVQPEGATFNACQSALAELAREGIVQSQRRERDLPVEYSVGALPSDLTYCEKLPLPWRWDSSRGPYVGVYEDLPRPGRVFWQARWIVGRDVRGSGCLPPLPPGGEISTMAWPAIWYECQGAIDQGLPWANHLSSELVGCGVDKPAGNLRGLQIILEECRRGYSEFLAPWSWENLLGMRLYSWPQRPGWELPPGAVEELRRAGGRME
jgi:hypothetical protein